MLGTLRCASYPVGLLLEDGADSPVDIGGCVSASWSWSMLGCRLKMDVGGEVDVVWPP